MRFVVIGAGAVGGVVGGRLAEGGQEVVLVARGPHLDAIRERGLEIACPDGTATVEVTAVPSVGEVEWKTDDVAVLAVKSQHTVGVLTELAAVAPDVPVVCLQNGVANEREALRRFERVYGVCVMLPTGYFEPGRVIAYSAPLTGQLDIGRYPEGTDDVAEAVAAAFETSSFESVVRADVMAWKRRKLLTNLGNALEAACGPAGRFGELADRARVEGEAALEAAGLAFVSREEDKERRGDRVRMRAVGDHEWGGGSSWQSLARGTGDIETDFLNGEIVLLGRLHGVPTPVNALAQRVATELSAGGAAPASLTEDDLLARLEADGG